MKTVIEKREQAVAETQAARDISDKVEAESRGMTDEEQAQFTAHMDKSDTLERSAAHQERLEKAEERLQKPQGHVPVEKSDGRPSDIRITTPSMLRRGKLRAFTGPNAEANAYRSGKWLQATVFGNAEARQYCRDHSIEMRVQTEGTNTAGGFLVPDQMEQAIIDLRETYGVYRQESRVIPMASDHDNIPRRSSGLTAYFVGETAATTESNMAWNNVELTAKELSALTRMSNSLNEDAIINMTDTLTDEMAYAFAAKEDACGLDGDGTNTYGGMMGMRVIGIDGVHLGAYVSAITTGNTWGTIDDTDLATLMAAIPAYALPRAKWYVHPAGKAGLFDRLAMAAGGNTAVNLAAGAQPSYAGYPIVSMAAMPALATATNSIIVVYFGDLSLASTFGDRRGITLQASTERYIEYRQTVLVGTERFCVVNHDIGGAAAATRGPICGLYTVA